VSGAGTFCNSATLTASGGAGGDIYYQGTTSNGTSTVNQTNTQVVTATGTYYFRSKSTADVWGPQGSAAVTINPSPSAPTLVSGNTNVCNGTSTTLTASGGTGTGYQWYANGCGSGSVLSTSSTLTVSPSVNTTYYVRSTSSCGVSSCISKPVTVTAPPVVSVINRSICGPGTATLLATTTSGTIEWYSSPTGGSPIATGGSFTTPTLSSTTTYYVGVTGGSCDLTTRTPVTATVTPIPGDVTVTLQSSGPGYAIIAASGGAGGTIYFQGTEGNASYRTLGGTPQTVTSSGTYYFKSYNNGCWGNRGSLNVTVPAGLSNLVLSDNPGYFNFSSNVYNYNSVRYLISTTNSITVTPTGSGTITVNGSTVSSGSPSSPISISDGNEKTITVNVTQGASNATYTIKVRKIITSGGSVSQGISGGYAYRVHRFSSNGTFTSNIAVSNSLLLVVGGGGGGGAYSGAGGDAGRYVYSSNYNLTSGSKSVVIGTGGRENATWPVTYTPGSSSSFGSVTAVGGATGLRGYENGYGGANGLGVSGASFTSGGAGAPGISNSITGVSITYAKGGHGGATSPRSNGTPNTGNGADSGGSGQQYSIGGSGVVVVRLQVPI